MWFIVVRVALPLTLLCRCEKNSEDHRSRGWSERCILVFTASDYNDITTYRVTFCLDFCKTPKTFTLPLCLFFEDSVRRKTGALALLIGAALFLLTKSPVIHPCSSFEPISNNSEVNQKLQTCIQNEQNTLRLFAASLGRRKISLFSAPSQPLCLLSQICPLHPFQQIAKLLVMKLGTLLSAAISFPCF